MQGREVGEGKHERVSHLAHARHAGEVDHPAKSRQRRLDGGGRLRYLEGHREHREHRRPRHFEHGPDARRVRGGLKPPVVPLRSLPHLLHEPAGVHHLRSLRGSEHHLREHIHAEPVAHVLHRAVERACAILGVHLRLLRQERGVLILHANLVVDDAVVQVLEVFPR